MSVKLISKSYTDIYGNSGSDYKANAGDTITSKLTISSDIYVRSSSDNSMSFDNLDGVLKQSQGDFIESGFRKGMTIYWKDINNANVVTSSWSATINDVYPLYLVISGSSLPNVNNSSSQGSPSSIWIIYTDSVHDEINLSINFTDSNNPSASSDSLVDGEESKLVYQGLSSLSVSSIANLTQVGKKSGQFAITNTTIKRLSDSTNVYVTGRAVRNYEISFTTIFVGVLFEEMFKGKSYLKQFTQLDFRVVSSETNKPTTIQINDDCNTGWFDESYNTEIPKLLSITNNVTALYYNSLNTVNLTIQVKGTTIDKLEIGGCYSTLDDTYNLNQAKSQSDKLFLLKTGLIGTANIGNTFTASGSSPYTVKLTAFSYADAGGNRTFTVSFELNPLYLSSGLGDFIATRGTTDRVFYLWVKADNYNALISGSNLEYKYAVGKLVTPTLTSLFNHSYNVNYSDLSIPASSTDFNLEDDLGFIADFSILKADVNSNVKSSIVVVNNVLDKEFVLESINFDLSNQDFDFWADQTIALNNNLPQSSLKKEAYLMESSNNGTTAILRLYYPFLIKWEYWEKLVLTHPYFSSQNKNNNNWYNFQVGDWSLKVKVEIERNGAVDWFYKNISIKTYDDSTVTSVIQLFDYPSMTAVTAPKKGKQILIRAIHTAPTAWGSDIYGQITVENKESSPRWVFSTEIDTNTDASNPLYGITDNKLNSSGFSTTAITLECLLDMEKVTGDNICITSKISDDCSSNGDLFIYTTGIGVSNTNSINFITA
jgi:hypothetical protein